MQAFDVRVQVQDIVRVFDGGVVGFACWGLRSVRRVRVPLSAHDASGAGAVVVGAAADVVLERGSMLWSACQQYSDRAMRLSGTVDIAALQCCGVGCCCAARSFADGVSRVRGCGVPAGSFRRIEFEVEVSPVAGVSEADVVEAVLAFGSD